MAICPPWADPFVLSDDLERHQIQKLFPTEALIAGHIQNVHDLLPALAIGLLIGRGTVQAEGKVGGPAAKVKDAKGRAFVCGLNAQRGKHGGRKCSGLANTFVEPKRVFTLPACRVGQAGRHGAQQAPAEAL